MNGDAQINLFNIAEELESTTCPKRRKHLEREARKEEMKLYTQSRYWGKDAKRTAETA